MRAIPTVDRTLLGRPALRTALVAVLLALALGLAGVAVAQSARGLEARQDGLVARGESVVVVIDLSLSIPAVVYRRMRRAIDLVSRSSATVGLVIFSDGAYELLPPGTPATELRPLLRFFTPAPRPSDYFLGGPYYPPDPWSESFRSGTRISVALELARAMVERDGGRGSVLLLSDLHSAEVDREPLQTALRRLVEAEIPLRIVPLFPLPENRGLFVSITGPEVFGDWERFVRSRPAADVEAAQASAASPRALVLAGIVLLVLLAANELWCRRLELPEAA